MPDGRHDAAIGKGMRTLWFIWSAIFVSLFVYILIAHFLGEGIRQNAGRDLPVSLIRNVLICVGAVTLLFSKFLRKKLLTGNSVTLSEDDVMNNPVSDPALTVGRYTVATVLSLALAESVGIYGLVLFFLGDNLRVFYGFIGISAVAMFIYRPRQWELEALIKNIQTG